VDNALRVLLLFRDTAELRLSDVAEQIHVSPSTAHRLLAALVRHGFVQQRGERGAYSAGPALLEIGYGAVRSLDLPGIAAPILARLAASIDETVHLAQLEGGQIRYLAGSESSQYLRTALRTGLLFPAHLTATGRAILAGLTAPQLDELLAGAVTESGATLTKADVRALTAALDEVRTQGYAINHRADGVVSIAVPVLDRQGRTAAAINASAPASRIVPDRVADVVTELRKAAGELGDALRSA
jgi:DNA-binding IclR family transcriptional regulator